MAERSELWWTPKRWRGKPASTPYAAAAAALATGDWPKALLAAGYTAVGPIVGHNAVQLHYALWKHKDGHLAIEVWDTAACITNFFVASRHCATFMVDKYPDLIRATEAAKHLAVDHAAKPQDRSSLHG